MERKLRKMGIEYTSLKRPMKDYITKVTLEDGGDGSVFAKIWFEDGGELCVCEDPCRCWEYGKRDTSLEPDEWGEHPIIHECTTAYEKKEE